MSPTCEINHPPGHESISQPGTAALFSGAIWEAERVFLHMGLSHINRGHLLHVSATCLDFSETHEKMILVLHAKELDINSVK